jgi:hypothetical protein
MTRKQHKTFADPLRAMPSLMMLAAACLGAAGPIFAAQDPTRKTVEVRIESIYKKMRAIRSQSPFIEPHPRESLEQIVADPARCAGRGGDKYCRLYDEVLKKKPGLGPEDVFAAFTAEEIIRHKLLQAVTGCTGDARVFYKFAREIGLEVLEVGSVVKEDYVRACYEGGTKLEHIKPGAHLNGHAGMAVRWDGQWRLLDTSDYEGPSYARSGPAPQQKLTVDKPEDLLGKEVYFGFPSDPYLVTTVSDRPSEAATYQAIERGAGADGCRFAAAPEKPWTACRYEGRTEFDDGISLDFDCGRCYIHRSRMTELKLAVGVSCDIGRHAGNGKGDIKDCTCVRCGGAESHDFYGEGCR